jgi:hypothetical protein
MPIFKNHPVLIFSFMHAPLECAFLCPKLDKDSFWSKEFVKSTKSKELGIKSHLFIDMNTSR